MEKKFNSASGRISQLKYQDKFTNNFSVDKRHLRLLKEIVSKSEEGLIGK